MTVWSSGGTPLKRTTDHAALVGGFTICGWPAMPQRPTRYLVRRHRWWLSRKKNRAAWDFMKKNYKMNGIFLEYDEALSGLAREGAWRYFDLSRRRP